MKKDFSNLSLRLKFALKVLGISQTELAKRINVKPQVIQYLCASQSQKSKFTCEISEALNIDFTWLATGKGIIPDKLEAIKNENVIPLLSFEQIREWKVYGNKMDTSKIMNWIPINGEINQDFFAVVINDRAMAPRFDLNTVIIIEPVKLNNTELNGFILVYLSQEDFVVFRQLVVKDQKKLLVAINKNLHKDILLKKEDLILGVCKEARWSI